MVFGQPQLIIARPKRTFRVPSESRAWNRSSVSLYIGIGAVKPSNGRLLPLWRTPAAPQPSPVRGPVGGKDSNRYHRKLRGEINRVVGNE
jgi:hypothetical protein